MKHGKEKATRPSWRAGRAETSMRADEKSIAERAERGGWYMGAVVVAIVAFPVVWSVMV